VQQLILLYKFLAFIDKLCNRFVIFDSRSNQIQTNVRKVAQLEIVLDQKNYKWLYRTLVYLMIGSSIQLPNRQKLVDLL
jgi:hypothetical protein